MIKDDIAFVLLRRKRRYSFFTKLSIDECVIRLASKISHGNTEVFLPPPYNHNRVEGNITGRNFQIKTSFVLSYSSPVNYGSFAKANGGTQVTGHTMPPWDPIIFTCFLPFMSLFLFMLSYLFVISVPGISIMDIIARILFFIMLVLSIVMFFLPVLIILSVSKQEKIILDFLKITLEATPVNEALSK
jgi:hypothetical protein